MSARAAPVHRMVLAQARSELVLTLRRGESLLATFGIPLGLLLFFNAVDVVDLEGRRLDFLVPGVLTVSVMATAMVSLGIATGFERQYLALKRLGGTPLPRAGLLAAKTLAVLAVEAVQAAAVLGLGALLGWDPGGRALLAIGLALLGSVAFAGLGLLMAGALRAEMTLALDNALYVFMVLAGGVVIPLERLPGALRAVGRALPASALADVLRGALAPGASIPGGRVLALAIWAAGASAAAAVAFRWE